jgi:hypothetical protein
LGGTGGLGTTGRGRTQIGTTSPLGKYYGNPLAAGLPTARNPQGTQYERTFPVPLTFGNPIYDTATLTRTQNQGTTVLGGLGGLGTTGTTQRYAGASSVGIRRAPGYITEPVFDLPARPSMETLRDDLQGVISRSSRLPSRDAIQVLADGETIILRGRVRDERERRLTEAILRLSPGVRLVKNELQTATPPPRK